MDENGRCPFCGGEVDPEGWLRNDGVAGPECDTCGATAPSIGAWNARAGELSVSVVVEFANLVKEGTIEGVLYPECFHDCPDICDHDVHAFLIALGRRQSPYVGDDHMYSMLHPAGTLRGYGLTARLSDLREYFKRHPEDVKAADALHSLLHHRAPSTTPDPTIEGPANRAGSTAELT